MHSDKRFKDLLKKTNLIKVSSRDTSSILEAYLNQALKFVQFTFYVQMKRRHVKAEKR